MPLIICPDCGKEYSDAAPACPKCSRPTTATASGKERKFPSLIVWVVVIFVITFMYQHMVRQVKNHDAPLPVSLQEGGGTPEPAVRTGPRLKLLKANWSIDGRWAQVVGQVRNLSDTPLKNVDAVASLFDQNGDFITSETTLIDFNPILPGQTSPFHVLVRSTPKMRSGKVEFKHLTGGTIETEPE